MGRVDGRLDLALDLLGKVVGVLDAHAAGVDQFGEAAADVDQVRNAVAGDAGRRIDNGKSLPGEPVEDARLAHVGTADNDNLWNSHNLL